MREAAALLEDARCELGLSVDELWFRYFALGGMRTGFEVEAILQGALVPSAHDRDLLAVALNERFAEQGSDPRLPYSGDRASDS